jgi:phytoene synthase
MTLEESYRHCERIARQRARNFYYSFVLLSAPQRKAMCAIYAFMRYCDDLSDDENSGDREAAIAQWRQDLDAALAGSPGAHPIWPAFRDAVERYSIPHRYFHEMIEGVSSDLKPRRIGTFDELYDYCYHVASVVGLTVIHIFGFDSPDAPGLAEKCGIAFQITNILRDIREDAGLGRIYLPSEDLDRFGVSAEDLTQNRRNENFLRLMRFEADRAGRYYRESAPLLEMVHPGSRASLWALIEIYSRLLKRIEKSNFDVLSRRNRVPAWEKAWIVARATLRRARVA